MKGTLDIHRELLARDVPHEVVRLPRLVLAADELPEALALEPQRCVAVRVYETDVAPVAVITRAGEVPDPTRLLNLVGAGSIRAASADRIHEATDFAAGLVPPFLLPPDMIVVCDSAVAEVSVVYTPTGESGTAVGIQSTDLLATTRATMADLCSGEGPAIFLEDVDAAAIQAERPVPIHGQRRAATFTNGG